MGHTTLLEALTAALLNAFRTGFGFREEITCFFLLLLYNLDAVKIAVTEDVVLHFTA